MKKARNSALSWQGQFGTLEGAEKVAEQLGHMTAAWSYLENQFSYLLLELTGVEPELAFALMYSANATGARLEMLRLVLERQALGAPFKTDCLQALDAAGRLLARRNELTHQTWVVDRATGKAYTFDFRSLPDAPARRTTRTPRALKQFNSEILDVCERVERAIFQVRAHKRP